MLTRSGGSNGMVMTNGDYSGSVGELSDTYTNCGYKL